jgi:hypothetical protein
MRGKPCVIGLRVTFAEKKIFLKKCKEQDLSQQKVLEKIVLPFINGGEIK